VNSDVTPQEEFWTGEFGDEYTERNVSASLHAANLALFGQVLSRTHDVSSILELGANRGLNLRAISQLRPDAKLTGVEINASAAAELRSWGGADVIHGSILEFAGHEEYDLTFTKGVLIHINPDRLSDAYEALVGASRRYVFVAEYYNPTPVAIPYRGHDDRLYKRDFAGELIDGYGLKLLDYGFLYRRDPNFPQDDANWFLLEKP
jgi:pseudaminic acid biosynthesis-associated methylase